MTSPTVSSIIAISSSFGATLFGAAPIRSSPVSRFCPSAVLASGPKMPVASCVSAVTLRRKREMVRGKERR